MNIKKAFTPILLMAEVFYPYINKKGFLTNAIKRVIDGGFYEGAETSIVQYDDERKIISRISKENNFILTQWIIGIFQEEGLSLSSIDNILRKKSVQRAKELIYMAAECNTKKLGLGSGKDPGEKKRMEAVKYFYESLHELCEEISLYKGMNLILEPFDRYAHKKKLFGPTEDTVQLIQRLRQRFLSIGISWDSAHTALSGEDIFKSLSMARDYIKQIHLSNAVLDKNDSEYGDNHIPMGGRGFLSIDTAVNIFKKAIEFDLFIKKKISVSIEVRTKDGQDPWETEKNCRKFLLKAWKKTIEGGAVL